MKIIIRGVKCEAPPNCPMIQTAFERVGIAVDTEFGKILIPSDDVVFVCICESFWRREAERLRDGPQFQWERALMNAETFACVHRSILVEGRTK